MNFICASSLSLLQLWCYTFLGPNMWRISYIPGPSTPGPSTFILFRTSISLQLHDSCMWERAHNNFWG